MDNFRPLRLRRRRKEEKHRLLGLRPAGSRPSATPDRYAILPPGIPTMSRLRRRAFVDLGYGVTVTPLSPAHHQAQPSKMAFQKSQADMWAFRSRGPERRKRPHRGDFRPAQPHSGRRPGVSASEPPMALYGLPRAARFFRREILAPFKRPHALSKRPANSRSA